LRAAIYGILVTRARVRAALRAAAERAAAPLVRAALRAAAELLAALRGAAARNARRDRAVRALAGSSFTTRDTARAARGRCRAVLLPGAGEAAEWA
jgi:hypothetical protein